MSQAMQKASGTKIQTIAQLFEKQKPNIAQVLPRGMDPDQFVKIAIAAIVKTPKLQECTAASLYLAVSQAAQLGAIPGALGHGYLVPYGSDCQFILGYRGMIDLARRSGQIVSITAEVVREGDVFECELGLAQKLKHVPNFDGERGKVRLVYAIAHLVGGGVQFVVLTREDVESKHKPSNVWRDHWNEMAKKTAVRQLFKMLPVSVQVAQQLEREDDAESGRPVAAVVDVEAFDAEQAEPAQTQTEKIKATLDAAKQVEA
jgi:recombination protein RecT